MIYLYFNGAIWGNRVMLILWFNKLGEVKRWQRMYYRFILGHLHPPEFGQTSWYRPIEQQARTMIVNNEQGSFPFSIRSGYGSRITDGQVKDEWYQHNAKKLQIQREVYSRWRDRGMRLIHLKQVDLQRDTHLYFPSDNLRITKSRRSIACQVAGEYIVPALAPAFQNISYFDRQQLDIAIGIHNITLN